jgi:hypothetical protein
VLAIFVSDAAVGVADCSCFAADIVRFLIMYPMRRNLQLGTKERVTLIMSCAPCCAQLSGQCLAPVPLCCSLISPSAAIQARMLLLYCFVGDLVSANI